MKRILAGRRAPVTGAMAETAAVESTGWSQVRLLRRTRVLACSAAIAVAVVGCTTTSVSGRATPAAGIGSPGTAPSTSGSRTPTPSRSASVSASADPPAASSTPPPAPPADGANVAACRDGICEVAVTPGAVIPVAPALGVTTVTIAGIGPNEMTIVFMFGQGSITFDSHCNSASIGETFAANCSAGQTATGNHVAVQVASIGAGTAVLRFSKR